MVYIFGKTWEENLEKNVRWGTHDEIADVCFFVNKFLPNISSDQVAVSRMLYDMESTWEYNLEMNVRWGTHDTIDDVFVFVRNFINQIKREENVCVECNFEVALGSGVCTNMNCSTNENF